MDIKIVIPSSTNPYTNIAREYGYYEHLKDDEIVFMLWQNEPCVVMGRNQNIYSELNLEYLNQNKILPVRRFTGGGSVYHDLGNLNFTFISGQKTKRLDIWLKIILNALKKEGIEAELSGRNDVLADGKKISGMAWLEDDDKFLIHGTLMVNVDVSELSECLTPDISKFIGKGIKSVKSRVVNLKDLNTDISVESLKNSLIESFKGEYPTAELREHVEHPNERDLFNMLRSQEWIYGKREKAQIQRSFTLDGKPLILDIYIDNCIIGNVDIYTDGLDLNKVERIKNSLIGKEYENLHIEDIVESIWIGTGVNSCLT